MAEPVLELRGISKSFGGVRALAGVSFDLRPSEVHALCGENGAGKSTLLKVLSGYYPAATWQGEMLVDGAPVRFSGIKDAEHHGIALIAQELALAPDMTIAENVVLGREPVKAGLIDWDAVDRIARDALQRVGVSLDVHRKVRELGVGQQQLVEIGKALARDARVLVLDEPTAALTGGDAERLLEVVRGLRARGVPSVYVSHRLDEVFQIADRVTVLRDGRTVGTVEGREATRDRIVSMMVGREVQDLYPRPPRREGAVALAVRDLSVDDPLNPGRRVVDGVSFEVREGEVLGLAGLMGAGRTAILSALFGAAKSRVSGQIALHGGAPRAPFRTPAEAIAAGVALVSEDRKVTGLVGDASVEDNTTLATLRRFVRGLFVDHGRRRAAAKEQLDAVRTRAASLEMAVKNLSGGNQQKVVLARWLLAHPRVLLLDEPTRGIDVGARAEIYDVITRLATAGLAVVLVSSDLPELLGLSHRVVVLARGRAAAALDGAAATPEAVMAAATGRAS
jgi:D-xylose transport system ATP-binding protein